MLKIFLTFIFITYFLTGCFSEEQKQTIKNNRIELGNVKINYYSDKSVTSLEIPPDLTSPSYENSFRLNDYVNNVDSNTINLTNKESETVSNEKILNIKSDISVMKSGSRRWLVVDKDPDLIWDLSKQFLKEKGFVIKKIDKKIGVMETDYLENKPVIPGKSLGVIRSLFASSIDNVSYTLPSVDKYKIRIEPIESGSKSEVHLSLSSMKEVVKNSGNVESTIWQEKEKDVSLETEMLYLLMVYLGGESAEAREKIINAKETEKIIVTLSNSFNGYKKLTFKQNILDTWDNLAWALLELNIQVEDKDIKEKAFYIKAVGDDIGLMSKLLGTEAISQQYQISLKEIDKSTTEIYFNDLEEKNESSTKNLNFEIFEKIHKLFN